MMKMVQQDPQKTIFVANIHFDATEQSIRDCFESFSLPVRSVSVVYDRITGKSRGNAYVEFHDVSSAQSAIKNVNNHEMNGRQLKVAAYVPKFPSHFSSTRTTASLETGRNGCEYNYGPLTSFSSCQPEGIENATSAHNETHSMLGYSQIGPSDEVTQALGSLSKYQLYEVLVQIKAIDQKDPEKARKLLIQQPTLTRAIFQVEIMLGLIRHQPPPDKRTNILQSNATASSQNHWTTHVPKYPSSTLGYPTITHENGCHMSNVATTMSPNSVTSTSYNHSSPACDGTTLDPAQQQALNTVINMKQSHIDQLPSEKREAVLQIRRQLGISV